MRINKLLIAGPVIILILSAFTIDFYFDRNSSECGLDTFEIWSHRGVHDSLPENSVEAVSKAYSNGFTGVEIDLFYDDSLGFVVSHDYPYIPVNGELLDLERLILGYDDSFKFWLDLKNLDKTNISRIIVELDDIVSKEPSLINRCYIESSNGWSLRRLSKRYHCIYWVQYSRNPLQGLAKRCYIKYIMAISSFSGITTDHRYIDGSFSRFMKNKCWYVFTVNTPGEIKALKNIAEVKVVLTDLPGISNKMSDRVSQ